MKDKRLFKGYGWDIYGPLKPDRITVFAHHRACSSEAPTAAFSNSWWLGDSKPECVMCGLHVPEQIQALVTLYDYGKETDHDKRR